MKQIVRLIATIALATAVLGASAVTSTGASAASVSAASAAPSGPRCARVDHWVHWFDQFVKITNHCSYTVSAVVRHSHGPDSPCYIIRPGKSRKYSWPRFRQAFQGIRWNCA